jgi:hypothetical protein
MAKLAAQLKNKFFGFVGRITSCGRAGAAYKDAGNSSAAHAPPSEQKEHPSLLHTLAANDSSVVSAAGARDQVSDISGLSLL